MIMIKTIIINLQASLA